MDSTSLSGKTALDLFPDLFRDHGSEKKSRQTIPPPPPPDISWLADGMAEREVDWSSDTPAALVAIAAAQTRKTVENILVKMGYTVHTVRSVEQAIQRLQAIHYHVIICGTELAFKGLHHYFCQFPCTRRRETYYGIVGIDFHTLSNIEALALSANLVINNRDLPNLESILCKGFSDYETLFRSFLDSLNAIPST